MFRTINEITFKVNPYCNLNCVYCFQTYDTKTVCQSFKWHDQLVDFMLGLPLAEQVEFKLTGGESSLFCDDIRAGAKKLRRLERKMDIHVFFTTITNGTNMEGILKLMDDGILDPYGSKFSWDGIYSCSRSRKPKNDEYTDEFFNNKIKLLGRSKYADKVLVRTAVTPDTVDDLSDALQYCLDNGCTKWEYYFLTDCEEYRDPAFIKKFSEQMNEIAEIYSKTPFGYSNWETMAFTESIDKTRENHLRSIGCRHLGKSLYIHDNGDVYPCGFFVPDCSYGGQFRLGSIFTGFDKEQIKGFIEEYIETPTCNWQTCSSMHCFECPALTKFRKGHMQDKLGQACTLRCIEHNVFTNYYDGSMDEKKLADAFTQTEHWDMKPDMPNLHWGDNDV